MYKENRPAVCSSDHTQHRTYTHCRRWISFSLNSKHNRREINWFNFDDKRSLIEQKRKFPINMFYYLFLLLIFLINNVSSQQQLNQCFLLNTKLNKYNINLNVIQKNFSGLTICENLIENRCCPKTYESQIQNATAIELYRLFELNTINLYEPLHRLTNDFNRM